MAHITTNSQTLSLQDELKQLFAAPAQIFADWRTYRRTLAELNGLSDRELQDLGLSRYSIRQVAYDSVYN